MGGGGHSQPTTVVNDGINFTPHVSGHAVVNASNITTAADGGLQNLWSVLSGDTVNVFGLQNLGYCSGSDCNQMNHYNQLQNLRLFGRN